MPCSKQGEEVWIPSSRQLKAVNKWAFWKAALGDPKCDCWKVWRLLVWENNHMPTTTTPLQHLTPFSPHCLFSLLIPLEPNFASRCRAHPFTAGHPPTFHHRSGATFHYTTVDLLHRRSPTRHGGPTCSTVPCGFTRRHRSRLPLRIHTAGSPAWVTYHTAYSANREQNTTQSRFRTSAIRTRGGHTYSFYALRFISFEHRPSGAFYLGHCDSHAFDRLRKTAPPPPLARACVLFTGRYFTAWFPYVGFLRIWTSPVRHYETKASGRKSDEEKQPSTTNYNCKKNNPLYHGWWWSLLSQGNYLHLHTMRPG